MDNSIYFAQQSLIKYVIQSDVPYKSFNTDHVDRI